MIHAEFLPWLLAGPSPSPSPSATRSDPQVIAAIIAVCGVILTAAATAWVQFSLGRRTSRDTQKALEEQREHLNKTLAEQRTRSLNERFGAAADKLGSDKSPAVRLAGVYAMAGLADDWEENRQTCVDVLCTYLHLPYDPDPGKAAAPAARAAYLADREVRHTVIRVITAHLKDGAAVSWQGRDFNFTGVVFDGGDFSDAKFSGGTVDFSQATFSDGNFIRAEFSGATVNFGLAEFSGGSIDFDVATFSGGKVNFGVAEFSGEVRFNGATFSGGEVSFDYARFSGGEVRFTGAEFSGGTVDFSKATFSGGTVDFSHAGDWSHAPTFPWEDTPPPGVKLPEKEDQSQAGPS